MFRLEHLYWLVAAFLLASAFLNLRARRWSMAAFWLVLAAPFVFGEAILAAHAAGRGWPAQLMGLGVIVLGLLATLNPLKAPVDEAAAAQRREADARRFGARLFVPALAIPLLTALLYFASRAFASHGMHLFESRAQSLIALGLASVLALAAAMRVTRAGVGAAVHEGRRLLDSSAGRSCADAAGALGVFAASGVGSAIAR